MDRGEFIKHGFRVRPAVNGGWVATTNAASPADISDAAAFSSFAEMIAWLEDQHEGLKIGEMAQKGEMYVTTAAGVAEVDPDAFVGDHRQYVTVTRKPEHPMQEDCEDPSIGQADMRVRVYKSCGYVGCTPATPWHGCKIHNPEVSNG